MAKVFHVLTLEEKEECIHNGIYRPVSLSRDGFIHLSKADQIQSVIKNFYRSSRELILWRLTEDKLHDKLVYEPPLEAPNSGVKYPHYYKELNINNIEKIFTLRRSENETFYLPKNLID
jgi:uncharacterized protein (DUF952 family)